MDYEAVQVFIPGLRQITEEFSSKSIVAAVMSRDITIRLVGATIMPIAIFQIQ
jgi:hypothetical protein